MYKINKLQGHMGFPDSSAGKKKKKKATCNPLYMGKNQVQSLGWEDQPGEGNIDPLQYSGL